MSVAECTPTRSTPSRSRTHTVLILVLTLAFYAADAWPAQPQYPVALMNWMAEGAFQALIVDKSQQRLSVWRIKDGEPTMIESYRCATGEKDGDKWVRGDMKTPEGVYFFCSVIDGCKLPPKYGLWAFTTDYPNFVDRRRGKSGDGIWLHGRDKPLGPRPDSNGCVALENDDLVKVSRFLRLQSTPMIVVEQMLMAPRSQIMEQERELRGFIESWRQAWESHDVDRYMKHYSKNFQSCWLDYASWKEKKRRLSKRYKKVEVKLGNVYLYRQNGLVTAIFTQRYQSDQYASSGIKVLYISHENGNRIYAEDYHQPVDDPNPVKSLLARVETSPGFAAEPTPEFRIKLVSTDEPSLPPSEEMETPRPVAPARAVAAEKMPVRASKTWPVPALEMNLHVRASSSTPAPMVIARAMPCESAVLIASARTRSDWLQIAGGASEVPEVQAEPVDRTRRGPTSLGSSTEKTTLEETKTAVARIDDKQALPESGAKVSNLRDVMMFLQRWKSAWEEKDLDRYMKMYHRKFQAEATAREQLERSKRSFFRKYGTIRVEIEQVEVASVKEGLRVKFLQIFRGDNYRDKGWKSMVLAGSKDKGFRILSETWSPL